MVVRRLAVRLGTERQREKSTEGLPLFTKTRRTRGTSSKLPPIKESQLHATVAEWLDWFLLPPALYTTFPAGWYKLPKAAGARLYRCGLKAGIPDLLIFYPGVCIGIELKPPGRTQSVVQREMAEKLTKAGVLVFVAHSPEEVMEILRTHKLPLRERVDAS